MYVSTGKRCPEEASPYTQKEAGAFWEREGKGKCRAIANVYWVSFGGDDIVLKLDLLMVAQLYEYFKNI